MLKRMKAKKDSGARSTRDLMGIQEITDYSVVTARGELVFFILKPTNLSVLPTSGIDARIGALKNVMQSQTELELLALNSAESFESNKEYYRARAEREELPAIRTLLEQDDRHLDSIQALIASAREFYLIVRLKGEREHDVLPYLSRIEKSIKECGFLVRRAGEQELMKMLSIYYEQNVTTEHFDSWDGERWLGECESGDDG